MKYNDPRKTGVKVPRAHNDPDKPREPAEVRPDPRHNGPGLPPARLAEQGERDPASPEAPPPREHRLGSPRESGAGIAPGFSKVGSEVAKEGPRYGNVIGPAVERDTDRTDTNDMPGDSR